MGETMKIKGWVAVYSMFLLLFRAGWAQAAFSDATQTQGIGLDGGGAAGAAWGDYDNDGDEDLYVTYQGKENSLYRNNGAGSFSDVTGEAGVGNPDLSCEAWGAAWGDYNNDGALDLYVTYSTGCVNQLFKNNGDGTFSDVTEAASVEGGGIAHKPSRTASWADYNRDNLLDVYIASRGDDAPDTPDRNLLYEGQTNGTFKEVAGERQVDGGTALSFTGVWSDYDNDGDLDLFLASDFHGLELFRNDGAALSRVTVNAFPGKLMDSLGPPTPGAECVDNNPYDSHRVPVAERGLPGHSHCLLDEPTVGMGDPPFGAIPLNAMGICAGDYDNDGFVDYYVTNFSADDYFGSAQDEHGKLESALWHNNGDGTFTEGARAAGLNKLAGVETIDRNGTVLESIQERENVEWGCNFLDYDLDGDLDLYVVSGDPPALQDPKLSKRDSLYQNNGNGTFTDRTEDEHLLGSGSGCSAECSTDGEAAGLGSAVADVDNDGDLDIFIANNRYGSSRLYLNEPPAGRHWLKVRLQGQVQKFGVGARVIVTAGGKTQIREVIAGSGYLSMDSLIQHFGLSNAEVVDQVEVRWPTGQISVVSNAAVDQTLIMQEAQGGCDGADTKPPAPPEDVIATAVGAGRIELTWSPSQDNLGDVCVQGYRIDRNKKGVPVNVSGTAYADVTVSPDTVDYCYVVTAIDTAGNVSEDSAEVCASTDTDVTAPSVPEGLAATVLSFRDMSLTWALSEDDVAVDAYQLYRDGQLLVTLEGPPYQDRRLTTGVSYCYSVLALDATGNASNPSVEMCETPRDMILPVSPTGLITTRVGATDVDLLWGASTDDVGVEKYIIYRDGILIGEPTKATFRDTGLLPGVTYAYLVYAADAAGNISLSSASLKVTTSTDAGDSGGGGGGNRIEEESDDRNESEKCFISTAAFGSLMASQLDILRAFREHYLQPYRFGRFLVWQYYHHSPSLAQAIVGNAPLRALVRMALWPIIGMAWMIVVSPLLTMLFVGFGLVVLLCYVAWRKSDRGEGGVAHARF